ncbi:MAG: DNA-3-methyladenine glycosylase I [Gemmatimonadota bacterium]
MITYCEVAQRDVLHKPYHDLEYGFPVEDDDVLFERLVLEINQAGLSWATILKKRDSFRRAYADFVVARVARFGAQDRARLIQDPGIIRNRLKIEAAIHNAQVAERLQDEYGSFRCWLDAHHPLSKADWVVLFNRTFRFTGGEIVGEFLLSTGYLPGAHAPDCAAYRTILKLEPPWAVL